MIRRILRLFRRRGKRPTGWPPHVFNDNDGRSYFGWTDFAQMPPARANEVDDIMLQIDAGLSHKQLATIAQAIVDALAEASDARDPKVKARQIAKGAALAMELTTRPKQIVPRECYYALAAVCLVRDDEDPNVFDPVVQAEKMQTFRVMAEAGHTPFSMGGAFAQLLNVTHSSAEDFARLSIGWMAAEARVRAMAEI